MSAAFLLRSSWSSSSHLTSQLLPLLDHASKSFSLSSCRPLCSSSTERPLPLAESAEQIKQSFDIDATAAADLVAQHLGPEHRAVLAAALAKHHRPDHIDDKYVEELFSAVDTEAPRGMLSRWVGPLSRSPVHSAVSFL